MTTPAAFIEAVVNVTGIPSADWLSDRRNSELVNARRILALALRSEGWSYPQIGRIMSRNHTSVMHTVGGHGRSRQPTIAERDLAAKVCRIANGTLTVEIERHDLGRDDVELVTLYSPVRDEVISLPVELGRQVAEWLATVE